MYALWLKNPQNYFKSFGQILFSKKIDLRFSKNLYFWLFLAKKLDKSSEPIELNRRRDACNSSPFKTGERISKFLPFPQKSIFGPQNDKNEQNRKIF